MFIFYQASVTTKESKGINSVKESILLFTLDSFMVNKNFVLFDAINSWESMVRLRLKAINEKRTHNRSTVYNILLDSYS
jgi:hypothetical protein